jgi:translation initiation factor 5B
MRKEEEAEREAAENERLQQEKPRAEPEKLKAKKQRELERKERLKAERKLMMVNQLHSLARSRQYFQALQDQGLKINQ